MKKIILFILLLFAFSAYGADKSVTDSPRFLETSPADSSFFQYDSALKLWVDIPASALPGGAWTTAGNYIYTLTDSVGIGTATPRATLQVNGDIYLGDISTPIELDASGTDAMYIDLPGLFSPFLFTTTTFEGFNKEGRGFEIKNNQDYNASPCYSFQRDEDSGFSKGGADSVIVMAGGQIGLVQVENGGIMKTTITDTLQVTGDFDYDDNAYGTASFGDSSVVITVTDTTSFFQVTNTGNDIFTIRADTQNVYMDSDTLKARVPGVYSVSFSLSYFGTGAAEHIQLAALRNTDNAFYTCAQYERNALETDVVFLSNTHIISLNADEGFWLGIKNIESTDNITVQCGNISINKVGKY
jgi:hypothetical protein